MIKYRVTIASTSYYHVDVECKNEDEAESEALKKFENDCGKAIGVSDDEVIELQEREN